MHKRIVNPIGFLVLVVLALWVSGAACQMDTDRLQLFACHDQPWDYCQNNFPGTRCVDGYCRSSGGELVCEPGASYCAEGVFHQCNVDGTEDTTQMCVFGCNASGDACNECEPGAVDSPANLPSS